MDIHVELENGLLPDRFGKYAPAEDLVDGHPCVSFPIEVRDVPVEALAAEKELRFERIDADTQAQREALIAERERLIARLAEIDEALND